MQDDSVINVLDKGFVRLEGFMGGDQAVVRAARISFGKTEANTEKDQKLIRYMLAHDHGTPFEHAVFQFHVKLPIFVARQWIRHRMSSYNEYSMRYSALGDGDPMADEFYIPNRWRLQDNKNKQGSLTTDQIDHEKWSAKLLGACQTDMAIYQEMISAGVAKEMARFKLPVNTYTQWYWTVNARALMHFIDLRSDSHAQCETRSYSHALARFFQLKMPWTFEAFMDVCAKREERKDRDFSELNAALAVNAEEVPF